jgi:hypothetical protein
VIDAGLYQRLMRADIDELSGLLDDLPAEDRDRARGRLLVVQKHARQLPPDCRLERGEDWLSPRVSALLGITPIDAQSKSADGAPLDLDTLAANFTRARELAAATSYLARDLVHQEQTLWCRKHGVARGVLDRPPPVLTLHDIHAKLLAWSAQGRAKPEEAQ